jgi:hypothetical protein
LKITSTGTNFRLFGYSSNAAHAKEYVTGATDPFTIVPGDLAAFSFSPLADGAVGNVLASFTVTAQDTYGNTKTDYGTAITV